MTILSAQTGQGRSGKLVACAILALAMGLALAGCGGAHGNGGADNPGLAGGSSSDKYNTYVGTQSVQWDVANNLENSTFQYGGVWDLAIDDSTQYFSYQNVGHQGNGYHFADAPPEIPEIGATLGNLTGNGFMSMTANGSTAPGSAGYAVEIPGEAAMFRPGDDTNPVVAAVETSNCLTLKSPQTYQFISLGTPNIHQAAPAVAYGSLQASTSGLTWNFSNLKMYAFDGTDLQPTQLPPGGCGETGEGFAISIAPVAATNNVQVTAQVGPTGYFVMDQGQGDPNQWSGFTNLASTPTGPYGLVGLQQPSSQLSTSAVVGAQYVGFQYGAIYDMLSLAGSWPVVFGMTSAGQAAGSGTTINGGGFKNDDVTQTPAANITIDLGTQDSSNNGLYKSVTVTIPDTYGECVAQSYGGTDADGSPTCTYQGEAIVGNPNSKYAIYVTANDLGMQNREDTLGQHLTPYAALDFFLYQP